jgi:DNA invertase Pin-like site-specific DNA recombinase
MDEPGQAIRVAIYCRLSKPGGRSVERQEQDGRKLAAERGWEVADVFNEHASASPHARKPRKQWAAFLQFIEAGNCDAVIFWMEDRSSRDVLAAGELVKVCQSVGMSRIVLPSLDYDLTDPEQVAKFYGEIAAAQREAAKTSKRTKRALLELAENGGMNHGGMRSFGHPGWVKVMDDDGRWQTVPIVSEAQAAQERALIVQAADRIIAGDSLRGICASWNAQGIASSRNGPWRNNTLRKLLLSPRMIGKRSHNGTLYDGNPKDFPVILPEDKWHAVRAVLEDPSRRTTMRAGVPAHLLTGLLFCAVCERPLRARMMTGKTKTPYRVYYCCAPNARGAYHVARHADSVDDLITEALFAAVESEDFTDAAKGAQADPTQPYYARLAELQALKDGLEDKFARDVIKEPAFVRNMAAFEAEEASCWAAIERLKDGRVRSHLPGNVRELWPSYSLDRKRAALRSVIIRIDVDRQTGPVFDPSAIRLQVKNWT